MWHNLIICGNNNSQKVYMVVELIEMIDVWMWWRSDPLLISFHSHTHASSAAVGGTILVNYFSNFVVTLSLSPLLYFLYIHLQLLHMHIVITIKQTKNFECVERECNNYFVLWLFFSFCRSIRLDPSKSLLLIFTSLSHQYSFLASIGFLSILSRSYLWGNSFDAMF